MLFGVKRSSTVKKRLAVTYNCTSKLQCIAKYRIPAGGPSRDQRDSPGNVFALLLLVRFSWFLSSCAIHLGIGLLSRATLLHEQSTLLQQSEDDYDRLSMLTDDILLSILDRVDIGTAAKTSVLSTRWRHLPWQLPKLDIVDVAEFLRASCSNPMEAMRIDEAMSALT